MTKREVIKCVLDGKKPPYVPWSFKFTKEPKEMLQAHYGVEDLDPVLGNHIMQLGSDIGFSIIWEAICIRTFSKWYGIEVSIKISGM